MELPAALLSRKQTKSFNPPQHGHSQLQKAKKKQKEETHKLAPENDLAERPQKTDDDDNNTDEDKGKDHGPSASAHARQKAKTLTKSEPSRVSEVNANAVPVPAPDTGLTASPIHPGILPVIPAEAPTTLTVSAHSLTPGFSPLPSMTALATATALSTTYAPTGVPSDTSRALSDSNADQANGVGAKHLPVVMIVLVSVGLGFLMLGAFIVWRARRRPRKRSCPTPSLPIFQDPFADQDVKVDEESLFGGKDRASAVARPNSNGLWTWTQYTPKPAAQLVTETRFPMPEPPKISPSTLLSEKTSPPPVPVHVPLPAQYALTNPPLQQMQNALTRAANRVSALSMSIYPMSPQSSSGIGLALGGTSPLTADGTPVLQRKPSANRLSKGRQSMRHSLAATEYLDMYADIYSGAQAIPPLVTSPRLPPPPPPLPPAGLPKPALRKSTSISVQGQGRARVKAPYNPGAGAVLRSSSTVAGIATLPRGNRSSVMAPSAETRYVLPPLSPAAKSDTRRERDTRALTSAMGLATPELAVGSLPPFSPQPTLYPDDSITLAGDRQRERGTPRTGAHHRVQSEAMSPGMEASARLGNLMLAEFTSMASLPSTRTVAQNPAAVPPLPVSGSKPRVARKNVNAGARADDKPPRVPSPPPLPSLAQMAMSHANPEEYADYRSPTYSIYGLYEAERKSRMPSEAEF